MKLPDVTPAQILAVIAFVLTQLVAYGLIDGATQEAALSAAGTVLPALWVLADSIIRHGRNQARAAAIAASGGANDPAATK